MKKNKKITRPAGKRPETTRCDGVTTYYRKGKVCHCSSKRPPGRGRNVTAAAPPVP